jgi:transcriptional regulator with XRE-family HTH domain
VDSFHQLDRAKGNLARNTLLARKCSRLNHEELVEICGITRPILSGIENESINPTLDSILKVSKSLEIEVDLLFIDEERFQGLQGLLKNEFDKAKFEHFEILITEKVWKRLLKLSELKIRRNYGRITDCIWEIVNYNFPDIAINKKKKMIYLAALGFLFQEDGFKQGMEFGLWLALKL